MKVDVYGLIVLSHVYWALPWHTHLVLLGSPLEMFKDHGKQGDALHKNWAEKLPTYKVIKSKVISCLCSFHNSLNTVWELNSNRINDSVIIKLFYYIQRIRSFLPVKEKN